MATYGVTYGSGRRQPVKFGTVDSRSGSGLSQSMQPLSSIHPNGAGFQAINAPAPLDALARVLQNGQDTFAKIAPVADTAKTSAPAATSVSAAPSSSYQGTDLSADPILNQIKAIGQRGVGDASSAALAGAKNDLINYGGVDVPQTLKDLFASGTPSNDALLGDLPANAILAALSDSGTASAAAANPFSTRAQLSNAHDANVHGIDQASNLSNLFYSSTHANQLGDENNAYLGSQNSALQSLAQALMGENNGVLNAINSAHDQYVGELPNAYSRAVAAGSGDPTVPTGGDGSGGGGGGQANSGAVYPGGPVTVDPNETDPYRKALALAAALRNQSVAI